MTAHVGFTNALIVPNLFRIENEASTHPPNKHTFAGVFRWDRIEGQAIEFKEWLVRAMRIGKEAEAELELVHQLYKLLPRKKQIKKIRVVAGALERIGATKKAFDQEVNIIQEKLHSRAPNDIFNAFIEACQNYAYYLRLLRRHLEKL